MVSTLETVTLLVPLNSVRLSVPAPRSTVPVTAAPNVIVSSMSPPARVSTAVTVSVLLPVEDR